MKMIHIMMLMLGVLLVGTVKAETIIIPGDCNEQTCTYGEFKTTKLSGWEKFKQTNETDYNGDATPDILSVFEFLNETHMEVTVNDTRETGGYKWSSAICNISGFNSLKYLEEDAQGGFDNSYPEDLQYIYLPWEGLPETWCEETGGYGFPLFGGGSGDKHYRIIFPKGNKEFKVFTGKGSEEVIITYQNQSTVQYTHKGLEINNTLKKWNGEKFVIAPEDIWIKDTNTTNFKFGANDTIAKENTKYQYTFKSNEIINFYPRTNGYYITHIHTDEYNQSSLQEVNIEFQDICQLINNCSFSLNNNELNITFTGIYNSTLDMIFIDPILIYEQTEGGGASNLQHIHYGQKFIANDTYDLVDVEAFLYMYGGNTNDRIFTLYTIGPDRTPNSTIGNIGWINASTGSASYIWRNLTVLNNTFRLTEGVEYAILHDAASGWAGYPKGRNSENGYIKTNDEVTWITAETFSHKLYSNNNTLEKDTSYTSAATLAGTYRRIAAEYTSDSNTTLINITVTLYDWSTKDGTLTAEIWNSTIDGTNPDSLISEINTINDSDLVTGSYVDYTLDFLTPYEIENEESVWFVLKTAEQVAYRYKENNDLHVYSIDSGSTWTYMNNPLRIYGETVSETPPTNTTCNCTAPAFDTTWNINMSCNCNITTAWRGAIDFIDTGYTNCKANVNTTNEIDLSNNQILYIYDTCDWRVS